MYGNEVRSPSPLSLVALLAGAGACNAGAPDAARAPDADVTRPVDAALAPPDAPVTEDADVPDAVAIPACACDPDETCLACFQHIGACCSGDPTIVGQATALAANCEARHECRVCCRECEATPCEVLRAGGSCPIAP